NDQTARNACAWNTTYWGSTADPTYDIGPTGSTGACGPSGTGFIGPSGPVTLPRWIAPDNENASYFNIRAIPASDPSANVGVLGTLPFMTSFVYVRRADLADASEVIYWCDRFNQRIQRTVVRGCSPGETHFVAWPVPAMRCMGTSMVWDATQKSVLFPY